MCFETSLSEAGSNSLNAVHFLAAFAITILLFGFLTGIQVIYVKRHRQRERALVLSFSRSRSMSQIIRKTLPSRLFLSGLLALLVLVLQQTVWSSNTRHDDAVDDDGADQSVDWWIIFLFVDGVLVALMLIAMNHILYWSYCHPNRDGPPCDETVAVSECDDDEGDECDYDKGIGETELPPSDPMSVVVDQGDLATISEEMKDQDAITEAPIQVDGIDAPSVARLDDAV